MEIEQIQQIVEKKIEIGEELAELRRNAKPNQKHGHKELTNYRTFKDLNIPNQVVNSVVNASSNYTIETLLKLLQEVGKTIKIVDL